MEGIYSSGLYSTAQSPYVLQPTHPDHTFQHSHYGNQYRSSAFSENNNRGPNNPYHSPLPQHSAGLSANNSSSYGHDIHHHDDGNYPIPPPPNHNTTGWTSPNMPWTASPPLPPPSRSNFTGFGSSGNNLPHMSAPMQRPRLTTTVWEDEGTICYQVDAKSVCVARRQDNDMINGTKLLNVVGMSRGKRDGILKNEKGRVVVKVGAMHLKGVWITFDRAKDLATKFKIIDILYPLFVDDPAVFLSMATPTPGNGLPMMLPTSGAPPSNSNRSLQYSSYNKNENSYGSFMPSWDKPYQSLPSITSQQQQDQMIRSQNSLQSGSCSPVTGNMAPLMGSEENDVYLLNNPYEYRNGGSSSSRPYKMSSPTTNNSSHYLYENNNSSSQPSFYESNYGFTSRKNDKEKAEPENTDEKHIDLPTSPPPESYYEGKFSSPQRMSNWSSSSSPSNRYMADADKKSAAPKLRSPSREVEEEKKGRKRGHNSSFNLQKKRVKVENTED